jgi:hypothetical protein
MFPLDKLLQRFFSLGTFKIPLQKLQIYEIVNTLAYYLGISDEEKSLDLEFRKTILSL